MNIVLTGVHGFVGGSVGRAASRQGHRIFGIARRLLPPNGWPGEYLGLEMASSELVPLLNRVRPDVIIHCAGSASVSGSFQNPSCDFAASAGTFFSLLEAVRKSSVRPLILFPSSAAVYGNPVSLPVSESARLEPISPYGFHKLISETVAQDFVRCFGLQVCLCRLFSVFGPTQQRLLVWELSQSFLSESENVVLQGTGEETRDYLHIDDVAATMLGLAEVLPTQPAATEPWRINIASGTSLKVLDLAGLIGRVGAWDKSVIALGDVRHGDPQQWVADISRLKNLLPTWHPESLETRLAETLREWEGQTCFADPHTARIL